MTVQGRALLAVAAISFGAALAIACSSFSANSDEPTAEAGPGDSAGDDRGGGEGDAGDAANSADAGDAAAARFCAQQSATAILCDDFEENDGGILSVWKQAADGGAVVAADAPMRNGHAAKITASGAGAEVDLSFSFAVASAIAGVDFDADMLIDTAAYDYIELCRLQTAGASAAYFGGVAKSGPRLGKEFTPTSGPTIPVDGAWHHVHVELRLGGTGFTQKVTIDTTTLEQTTTDLSKMSFAQIQLGVISSLPPGDLAVIYFDNVLLQSP